MMHNKNLKNIKITILLAIVGMAAVSGGAWPIYAQSSDWSDDWQEISRLYYDELQPAAAIQLLEQKLVEKGNLFSDTVLEGILELLKDYFSLVDDPLRFKEIIARMMRSGKDMQITDFFSDSGSLHASAQEARLEWLEPRRATIHVENRRLVVGETTEYSLTVYNRFDEQLVTEKVEISPSPSDKVELDPSAKQIKGVAVGRATLIARRSDGFQLGSAVIDIVSPPPVPTSAKVTFTESDALEIGESTRFDVLIYDQNNRPIHTDYSKLRFDLAPTNLATLDETERKITAREGGSLVLKVLFLPGTPLCEVNIEIKPEIVVKIDPPSAKIRVGEKVKFSMDSSRPLAEVGLTWAIEPYGSVSWVETTSQQFLKQIEVEGITAGRTYIRVLDKNNVKYAEASLDIEEKPAREPVQPQVAIPGPPPEDKGISIIFPLLAGGATAGLMIAAVKNDDDPTLAMLAGGCGVGTVILSYMHFHKGGSDAEEANAQLNSNGLEIQVGLSGIYLNYVF